MFFLFLFLLLFPFAWLGAIKDSFNDEEDRFSDLKKQKLRAEQKEFEITKMSEVGFRSRRENKNNMVEEEDEK